MASLWRVDPADLRSTVAGLLERSGLAPNDAHQGADVLVAADLRGVDTHGVSNMLRAYLAWLDNGHAQPRPEVRTIRETPATANVDGGAGLGIVVAPRAMTLAIDKASAVGVGVVTVHNVRHLGMAAYHAMLALPREMIGVCLTAGGPLVVPTWGREPRLGTNPIAVAAPAGSEPPFVYDASTSAIAGNAVTEAHRAARPVPGGVLAASDGSPVLAPTPAPPSYEDVLLLPLGTTRDTGSHKGYGLGAAVEVLTSVLGGATFGARLGRGFAHHLLAAVDVAAFSDVAAFKAAMDDFLVTLKQTPPAAGHERVVVAGQLEHETRIERERVGLTLLHEVVAWFDEACADRGVAPLVRKPDVLEER